MIVKTNGRNLDERYLEEGDEVEVCFIEASGARVCAIVWSWPAVVVAEGDHYTLLGEERSIGLSLMDQNGRKGYDLLTERFSNWQKKKPA